MIPSNEWVFADAKEKHGMRYTHYRGLAQVSNWVRLKFAAMNLKKLANWKARRIVPTPHFTFLPQFLFHILQPVWRGAVVSIVMRKKVSRNWQDEVSRQ